MSSKRRRASALARDTNGMAAVEFALVSPLLILVMAGAIQIGWVVHCAASVRWALEASGRAVLLNPGLTAAEVRTAMVAKLSKVADAEDIEVSITPDADDKSLVLESTYRAQLGLPMLPVRDLTFRNRVMVPTLNEGS